MDSQTVTVWITIGDLTLYWQAFEWSGDGTGILGSHPDEQVVRPGYSRLLYSLGSHLELAAIEEAARYPHATPGKRGQPGHTGNGGPVGA